VSIAGPNGQSSRRGRGFPRRGDETGGPPLSLAVRPEPIGALFPLTSVPRGSTLWLTTTV